MNIFRKKIQLAKCVVTLLGLLACVNVNAQSTMAAKTTLNKEVNEALAMTQEFWNDTAISPKVTVLLSTQLASISRSNMDRKDCQITLQYQNEQPVIFADWVIDIRFTLWHELAHCLLGKEVLYTNLEWKLPMDEKEKEYANELIEQRTHLAIGSMYYSPSREKLFAIAPPLVVYHEMFADIIASLWLLSQYHHPVLIQQLLEHRARQFYENPPGSYYASHFIMDSVLEAFNKHHPSSAQFPALALKMAQQGLLEYLRQISQYNPAPTKRE